MIILNGKTHIPHLTTLFERDSDEVVSARSIAFICSIGAGNFMIFN